MTTREGIAGRVTGARWEVHLPTLLPSLEGVSLRVLKRVAALTPRGLAVTDSCHFCGREFNIKTGEVVDHPEFGQAFMCPICKRGGG